MTDAGVVVNRDGPQKMLFDAETLWGYLLRGCHIQFFLWYTLIYNRYATNANGDGQYYHIHHFTHTHIQHAQELFIANGCPCDFIASLLLSAEANRSYIDGKIIIIFTRYEHLLSIGGIAMQRTVTIAIHIHIHNVNIKINIRLILARVSSLHHYS